MDSYFYLYCKYLQTLTIYVRLALSEEKTAQAEFGEEYQRWATKTPRFFPKLIR